MLAFVNISWATPFLIFAIYGLVRYFSRNFPKNKDHINWSPLESIGLTLAFYFVGQVLAALIIYSIPTIFGISDIQITNWVESNNYGQFLFVLAVETITFGLIFRFVKKRASSLKAIGLNRKPILKDLGWAALAFLVYFGALLVATAIFKAIFPAVNENQDQIIGFDNAHGLQLLFVFVSLVILPPFVEEVLARGFLFSGLKKGWPVIWAALATSVLFALAHLQAGSGNQLLWTAALDTFILSLVLIYLRQKTGSLWASIMLHMLKNGVAFFVLFVFHLS